MLTAIKYLCVYLITTLTYGQKIEYYLHGYDGIEKYGKWKDSTIIYSNYMAKPTIRYIVCDSILKRYIQKKPLPTKLVLNIDKATVYGTFKIRRKDSLVHLEFFYEKVVWKDSIIEKPKLYYAKSIPKNKKR